VSSGDRYWFPARRYGWGWGLPTAWQGWVVMLCCLGLIAVAASFSNMVGGFFITDRMLRMFKTGKQPQKS